MEAVHENQVSSCVMGVWRECGVSSCVMGVWWECGGSVMGVVSSCVVGVSSRMACVVY